MSSEDEGDVQVSPIVKQSLTYRAALPSVAEDRKQWYHLHQKNNDKVNDMNINDAVLVPQLSEVKIQHIVFNGKFDVDLMFFLLFLVMVECQYDFLERQRDEANQRLSELEEGEHSPHSDASNLTWKNQS